jgi:PAS domain S-box-containing protein
MLTDQKTILLVEDDEPMAGMQQHLLRSFGYNVVHAGDGERAIALCDAIADIDLVLMDIDLGPGMNGIETAKAILNKHNLPITFLSSRSDRGVVEITREITMYGYVVKPASIVTLDTSIKMALKLFESNMKLVESEMKFNKAFEICHSPMSINDYHDNGRFIDCNQAFQKLLGYRKEEIIGKTPIDVNLYADLAERKEIFSLLEAEGKVTEFAHRFRSKDGRVHDGRMSIDKIKAGMKDLLIVTVTPANGT